MNLAYNFSLFSKYEFAKNIIYALKVIKAQVVYFADVVCSLILISRKRSSAKLHTIRLFNKDNFVKHKKSDTLFIVASGSSLNSLSVHQWDIIQACDVLTFNHSYMLDVKPTYYLCYLSDDECMSKIGSDLHSIDEYHSTPKLFTPDSPIYFKQSIGLINLVFQILYSRRLFGFLPAIIRILGSNSGAC